MLSGIQVVLDPSYKIPSYQKLTKIVSEKTVDGHFLHVNFAMLLYCFIDSLSIDHPIETG